MEGTGLAGFLSARCSPTDDRRDQPFTELLTGVANSMSACGW
jgi:hypothetical protein